MIELFHKRMDNTVATMHAYDHLYQDKGIRQRDSFYLWLIQLIDPRSDGLLLDISTGEGRLVTLARQAGKQALGMDFSLEAVKIGALKTDQPVFTVADGECLPFADESIDYITHIGSLEHYFHPEQGACEIGRVLKPGGKALMLLPNAFGLFGNIKHVWLHGEVFDDGQPIQRYATRDMWRSILEQGGLQVDRTIAYTEIEFPRTRKDLLWLLAHPLKIIRGLLSQLIPLNLANHLVFICSRASLKSTPHFHTWTYRP
ncbi:MAG: class I SAM-dependent methyltransferase [Anaerolineaceae bacterium]|nr:class I SAM-dependent methyltransferase [Anaerolineaceae bacterium]